MALDLSMTQTCLPLNQKLLLQDLEKQVEIAERGDMAMLQAQETTIRSRPLEMVATKWDQNLETSLEKALMTHLDLERTLSLRELAKDPNQEWELRLIDELL